MAGGSSVFITALVNIIGGVLFGYGVGFAPPYNVFNAMEKNCTHSTGVAACEAAAKFHCVVERVENSSMRCLFDDWRSVHCTNATVKPQCTEASPQCVWDNHAKRCHHKSGWSPLEMGIFTGAFIGGALVGSLLAPKCVSKLGRKKTLVAIGVTSIVSSALVTVGSWENVDVVLIVGRGLLGIAGGLISVACPMYVDEMSPQQHRAPLGATFQLAVTFGFCLSALVGLLLDPTSITREDPHMNMRFQVLNFFLWLLSIAAVAIGLIAPESTHWEPHEAVSLKDDDAAVLNDKEPSGPSESIWKYLCIGLLLAIAMQLTGMMAIMMYAPQITKSVGFAPLLGNFFVMLWHFITCIIAVLLSRRFSFRKIFLVGLLFVTAASAFNGIAVLPSMHWTAMTRQVLAGIGILVFIAAFQIGIAPTFFVLAHLIFPEKLRARGCGLTMATMFTFNLTVSVCFPVSVVALSGGPSENQHKGMALVFFIFSGFGALSLTLLAFLLHPKDISTAQYHRTENHEFIE